MSTVDNDVSMGQAGSGEAQVEQEAAGGGDDENMKSPYMHAHAKDMYMFGTEVVVDVVATC